ncbi:MAG: hypothetical protein OEU90_14655, partial [Gammaproteobacteria bacterium]|nr:hypothetical protein [Gammaproteobacteria bacterium]
MFLRRGHMPVAGMFVVLLASSCGGGGGSGNNQPNLPVSSCMSRATFGDSTTSDYILPFPVGESSEVLQAYCTIGSHIEQ